MYFVRRKGRVKGPLTLEKLRGLRDEERLRMRDEIAESADGPWKRLTEVYVELLDEDEETPGDADSGVEEEFWEEKSSSRQTTATNKTSAANDAKQPRQPAGLFGGQLKLWQLVAGGIVAAGLAAAALVAGLLLSPVGNQPTDPNEIAAITNEAAPARRPPPRKRPAQSVAPATPPAANTPTAAPDPGPAPNPSGTSSPEATATAAAERPTPVSPAPAPASAPAPPPEDDPIEADPLTVRPKRQKVPADLDHLAAITATLTKYYSASSWQDRYTTVLPGPDVIRQMQPMYDDVDWVSVDWSIAQPPTASQLDEAAQRGERVRIDTLANGNPHSIYLVFYDGRWRVDWLHSLNTLWLTK